MNLWLDDIRLEGDGWLRAKGVNQAIAILLNQPVEFASLDHDLGIWSAEGGDGYKLVHWMIENNIWPTKGIRVHSSNPIGVERMVSDIRTYGPYEFAGPNWCGEQPAEGWPSTERYV